MNRTIRAFGMVANSRQRGAAWMLAAVFLSTSATAQTFEATPHVRSWAGTGNVTEFVEGNFLDLSTPDLLIVRDSFGFIAAMPRWLHSFTRVRFPSDAGVIHDADVIPSGSESVADAFAMVGPDGLSTGRYDPTSQEEGVLFTKSNVLGGAWLDAQRVIVADLDGDGTLGAVGLDMGGTAILLTKNYAGGARVTQSIPIPNPALDVELLDFSLAPGLEIAVADSTAVRVYDTEGALVKQQRVRAGRVELAAFSRSGSPHAGLATLFSTPSAQHFLLAFDANRAGVFFFLGEGSDSEPYGLEATDLTLDGTDDLVLLTRGSGSAAVFLGQNTTPWFSAANSEVLSFERVLGDGEAPAAPLLLTDMDDDGDPDLVASAQTSEGLWIYENKTIDASSLRPALDPAFEAEIALTGTQTHLQVYAIPESDMDTQGLELEVQVYLDQTPSALVELQSEMLERTVVDLPAPGVPSLLSFDSSLQGQEALLLWMRYVERDPDGNLQRAYPVASYLLPLKWDERLHGPLANAAAQYNVLLYNAPPGIPGSGGAIPPPSTPPPATGDDDPPVPPDC